MLKWLQSSLATLIPMLFIGIANSVRRVEHHWRILSTVTPEYKCIQYLTKCTGSHDRDGRVSVVGTTDVRWKSANKNVIKELRPNVKNPSDSTKSLLTGQSYEIYRPTKMKTITCETERSTIVCQWDLKISHLKKLVNFS